MKRRELAIDGWQPAVEESLGGCEEGRRGGASESRNMVARNVNKVNKIIMRLRSNAGRREVTDG